MVLNLKPSCGIITTYLIQRNQVELKTTDVLQNLRTPPQLRCDFLMQNCLDVKVPTPIVRGAGVTPLNSASLRGALTHSIHQRHQYHELTMEVAHFTTPCKCIHINLTAQTGYVYWPAKALWQMKCSWLMLANIFTAMYVDYDHLGIIIKSKSISSITHIKLGPF